MASTCPPTRAVEVWFGAATLSQDAVGAWKKCKATSLHAPVTLPLWYALAACEERGECSWE